MQKKTKEKGLNFFIILLGAVILYFSSLLVNQAVYRSQMADEQAEAEARLRAAKAENEELRAEKERLGDLVYVEKLAREELGMTRKGELPYSVGRK